LIRWVPSDYDLGFLTCDDVTASIEGGSVVSFLEVPNHPDLDHGREVGALGTDEHVEVSLFDVEVHLHLRVELLLAHEAILVDLLLDGHIGDVAFVVIDSWKM